MEASARKWGSLVLRALKALAAQRGIRLGSLVDRSLRSNELVVMPERRSTYDVERLAREISPTNAHGPVDWGEPAGRETL